MLTATYTLVALSVEQTTVRASLQSLQKLLRSSFTHQALLTSGQVEYLCDAVKNLYERCHWRKLDKFLIPALRRSGEGTEQLLRELDGLTRAAAETMTAALQTAAGRALEGEAMVAKFCAALDSFCSTLLRRLEREEQELFPLARMAVPVDVWFGIANQMLAHDAYQQESKPAPVPPAPKRAAPGVSFQPARQAATLTVAH